MEFDSGPMKVLRTLDLFFYAFIAFLWWTLSLTILFPLVLVLVCSKSFQRRFFHWLFLTIIAHILSFEFGSLKKSCFDMLKEKLVRRKGKKTTPLKVLEIGIGGGANFNYYPENSSLVAVDMNPNFGRTVKEVLKRYPNISVDKVVVGMAENMSEVDDDSIDVVISTHVLCSVTDVRQTLSEVRRVMKPGGFYLFLEHVAFNNNKYGLALQNCVAPLCRLYGAGCCLNRDAGTEIKKCGFSDVDLQRVEYPTMPLFFRPNIFGIAEK